MSRAPDSGIWNGAPRRAWAITATGIVHVLALLMVLVPSGAASPPAKVSNLVTFDSSVTAPAQAAASKPKQPKVVPPQPKTRVLVPPPLIELPIVTPQVVSLLEQADAQAAAGGCDLTAPVQAALQSSRAVQQELPRIPAERRSVANAIALWNQDWVEPDAQLKAEVLATIRGAIATTIEAASDACRAQPQGGPRLIYLSGSGKASAETTILALGSGAWTWQQIADTAQPDAIQLPGAQSIDGEISAAADLPQFFKTAFIP